MTGRGTSGMLLTGLVIWAVGTIFYAHSGATVLETSSARFWSAFTLSPIISAVICIAILRRRNVAPANWTSAMLLLALPGMVGEAVVLVNFSTFMPGMHVASAGRYGAFLFATYAFVLGLAASVTLGAFPRLAGRRRSADCG